MYKALTSLIRRDPDLPARVWQLTVLESFLDGSIYDFLPYEFHEERSGLNEYIPIVKRAPSVRYGLLKTVVNDSVSFLFAEGRFPSIGCGRGSEVAEATLQSVIKDCRLGAVMLDAATRGSVGSIAIRIRVLKYRLYFDAMPTTYLTPTFDPEAPDTLQKVTERYKVKGSILAAMGYTIPVDRMGANYWFQREWNTAEEVWFLPQLVADAKDSASNPVAPTRDKGNTVTHGLGFVPMVWVLNLPGGNTVDGACTFRDAIEDSIEINYQLSQAGRGLKYSSSPMLMLKDDGSLNKMAEHIVGDAIVVPIDGDAKLLEISGEAGGAVIAYVREIRKLALETVGGSRADSDKLSAATSGRAMEMMNQALINLADKLRSSYGEGALLKVLKMVAVISRKIPLVDSDGEKIAPIAQATKITLKWPSFYSPTSDDRQADAIALTTMTGRPVMSLPTAVSALASTFDVEDVPAEIARIEASSIKPTNVLPNPPGSPI